MSGYTEAGGANNSAEEDGGSGVKRKRDGGSGIQHRTKRNRYISIACNECKRRKIKCNGESPCQRCGNLNLECVYSPNCCSNNFRDSIEFKALSSDVGQLKEQVNHILLRLNNLSDSRVTSAELDFQGIRNDPSQFNQDDFQAGSSEQASVPIDPALQNRAPPRQLADSTQFQGSNDPLFGLDGPQAALRNTGVGGNDESLNQSILGRNDSSANIQGKSRRDPIWDLSKSEALRHCDRFEADIGVMFPIVDIDRLKRHTTMLFKFIEAVWRNFMMADRHGPDAIHDQDTDTMKLVVAISMIVEGGSQSELGNKLFEWVNKSTDRRLLGSVNVKDIQILTLTALYHFYDGHETLARRIVGLTARLCLELGLHRSETYRSLFTAEQEQTTARNLFWLIYILDHSRSFGSERSIAIQESDVDPELPRPTESSPYLSAMIDFCGISEKCRKYIASTNASNSAGFSQPEVEILDIQINQWYEGLSNNLRFVHPDTVEFSQYGGADPNALEGTGIQRLRGLLYLRANYLRISIHRTALYPKLSTMSSGSATCSAQTAVETSKDTIQILMHIHAEGGLYRTGQIIYNEFLLAALATIFLANCQAPEHFTTSSREEFSKALELVRGLSPNSLFSKRLWEMTKGLKQVEARLNLYSQQPQRILQESGNANSRKGEFRVNSASQSRSQRQNDAQRSAAMAMAGLAGHSIDENMVFGYDMPVHVGTSGMNEQSSPQLTNPTEIADDLLTLFESSSQFANDTSTSAGNLRLPDNKSNDLQKGNILDGEEWTANDEGIYKLLRSLY